MDILWIRTFVTAASEGNFRRTAEKLHLAQPTVSVHIQKLEEALGVRLFDRVGRNIVLNHAGRRFLTDAKDVLNGYDDALEHMAKWRQGYETSIRVAVSPIIATTVLPSWVQKFTSMNSHVEFVIEVMESVQVCECVRERMADIGLARIPLVDSNIECTPLYDDPVVLVGPRSPYDLYGPIASAQDMLLSQTLYTDNHPLYWEEIMPTLRTHIPQIRTMRVSQVYVTLEWIAQGMGVSFLPESTAKQGLLRGCIEEIPFPLFPLPHACTYLLVPTAKGDATLEFAHFLIHQVGKISHA